MNREDYKLIPLATIGIIKGVSEVYVKPLLEEVKPSTKAWATVVAGVIAYDALCPPGQTLSEGYDRFIDRHPVLALGAVAITAGHLANVIPERYDLIHRAVHRGA